MAGKQADRSAAASPNGARSKSLTATVVERLLSDIVEGAIPLGSLLSEKVLAESYGVSKTPVREALVQLQSMGLVHILPQRGGLVFSPDAEQVRELCEVRLELESIGLRLSMLRGREPLAALLREIVAEMNDCFDLVHSAAYQRLDHAFHLAFFKYCGNHLLGEAYDLFGARISALRTHLSRPQVYLLKRSLEEHRMMAELVEANDLRTALQLLGEHISRTRDCHSRALNEDESVGAS